MFFFFSNKLNPEPLSRGSRQYNTKKLHIFSNEFDWDAFSVLCSGRHLEILLLVFVFWCFRYCSEKCISKNLWSKNNKQNTPKFVTGRFYWKVFGVAKFEYDNQSRFDVPYAQGELVTWVIFWNIQKCVSKWL